MLTEVQIAEIMQYADLLANLEVQRGHHHALMNYDITKRLEKQVCEARKALENLLNMMKIPDK